MGWLSTLESRIDDCGYYPSENSSGDLTFVGVLRKYFEPSSDDDMDKAIRSKVVMYVRQDWNRFSLDADTTDDYISDYVNVVLPEIYRDRALRDYTLRDFELIKDRIRRKKEDEVSIERLNHFFFLIDRVYEVGVNNHLYPDRLKGTNFRNVDLSSLSDEECTRILMRPKSLTKEQEFYLLDNFRKADICEMRGETLAAYLQFFTGLRNEEIAGVMYSDLSELESGRVILFVTKSARRGGKIISLQLKTSNAYRYVPVFGFLADRLKKRREFIEQRYDKKEVSNFTIACRGHNYSSHVGTEAVSIAGRELIMDAASKTKDGKTVMSDLLDELREEGLPIDEKEPTAYLFRRNYATHLHNLKVDPSTADFLIGHIILEDGVNRHDFMTVDVEERIHRILDSHPFNAFFGCPDQVTGTLHGSKVILKLKAGKHYTVSLNEPNDDVKINMVGYL